LTPFSSLSLSWVDLSSLEDYLVSYIYAVPVHWTWAKGHSRSV